MKKYEIEVTRDSATESAFVVHEDFYSALNLFTMTYGGYGIKEVKYIVDVVEIFPSIDYNPDIPPKWKAKNVRYKNIHS